MITFKKSKFIGLLMGLGVLLSQTLYSNDNHKFLQDKSILLVNIISLSLGGTATHNFALYETLHRKGFNVDCLVGRQTPVKKLMLQKKLHCYQAKSFKEHDIIQAFKEILSEKSIDIIHCTQPKEAYCAMLATKSLPTKVILQNHSFLELEKRTDDYSYTKRELQGLNGLIAINSAQEEIIVKANQERNLGIQSITRISPHYRSDKFKNIETFDDHRKYFENQLKLHLNEGPIISIVGVVTPNKNQQMALDALAILKHQRNSKANLVIIGNVAKNMERLLRNKARKLDVEDCIHYLGHRHNVPQIVTHADLNLSTSKGETFSLALLEGGLLKKPTICTDIPGPTDFVVNGVSGLTFKSADAIQLANAIELYSRNPELAKQHGEALYNIIQKNHSIEVITKKLLTFYTRVLSS